MRLTTTTERRSLLGWAVRIALAVGLVPLAIGALHAQQPEKPRLLMLPIIVHSAESPDYVRGGLADMLSARFARTGALELVRVDDPARGTTQLEQAIAAGRRADADYVLFGSFTRFGKGASLDVQCSPVVPDATREPLREIFVHSGSIGEIIPDLDELVGKVSRFARGEALVSRGASAGSASASASTVSSPDLAEMLERIESLEATVTELLQGRSDAELAEAPGDEQNVELR